MITIDLAKDYTRYPAGRTISDGPFSGERFRLEILETAIKSGEEIQVLLDGARGHGSSFLEEAFGGLVRAGYSKEKVREIKIVTNDDSLLLEIEEYIDNAAKHINSLMGT